MLKIIINRKLVSIVTILAIISGVIFLLSSRIPQKNTQNGRIHIVASFYPISYVASSVGGNLVAVRNLVPAGVEPHDFEPSPRDLIEIGNADILLYNGAGLEPWIKKWEQGVSVHPVHIINMAEALKKQKVRLIEKDGIADPHFWLDPQIMKSEAIIVRDLLIEIDPLHKDMFTDNADRYISALDLLDQHFREGLSSCTLHDVIVLHRAFDYIASQYKFKATSIEGISPDEEPSPRELARIISLVREKGVKHIFLETISSPKFSELIAREVGGATLVLNPIESLTPDDVQSGEDYLSIMEMNLNNLQIAMSCN